VRDLAFRICVALLAAAFCTRAFADEKAPNIRAFASLAGRVTGAASACPNVGQSRVYALSTKITNVLRSSAPSDDEASAITDLFLARVTEGQRAVASGQLACPEAERDFANLESATAQGTQAAGPAVMVATQAAPGPGLMVHGISANEIRFGATVPLTGPNKEYGQQIRTGIETAFKQANDAGGVHGRMLKFLVADDGYEPARTPDAIRQLYEKDEIFGFAGNVGTANGAVFTPFALEHRMPVFAPFTGANIFRRDPPDRYVFNYRPSYAEETSAAVRYLVNIRKIKPEQIAVFAQQDSFGDAGYEGVAKVMRAIRGGDGGFILRLGYVRNSIDMEGAVAQLKASKTPIKAVVMQATYRAAAKFIEKSRDAYPGLIYTNSSVVGANTLRDELIMLGPKFAKGVIVTQAVPAVDGYSSLVLEYKAALAKYFGAEPPDVTSLEYYIVGRILVEVMRRAGPQPDSEKAVDAFESIRDYDIGLGTPINFGKSEHQGSHKVWALQLSEAGKYEPVELQ